MSTREPVARTSGRRSGARRQMSQRTRNTLVIAVVGVIVVAAGVWVFDALTAPKKPDLTVANPQQITEYLVHPRGFSRLSVPDRKQYLEQIGQYCAQPERFEAMQSALNRLSPGERQVFADATFEVAKEEFISASDDYARTPTQQRKAFVDQVITRMDGIKATLRGGAPPGSPSLADTFKQDTPAKSDAWLKQIVARTSPAERTKAKPLMDDMVKRYEEFKQNPQLHQSLMDRAG